ncbi:MAG: DUF3109 family protein [Chitinophagaceae bacterium]|jgi:hypothetical protein|nr:DUF3109 family protein [Chitinophagaceae bacterium]MCU0403049.1 DUF3109 family protein [Chitinophagaceae bacterium]
MIIIDNILVSDEVVEEQFVCDLIKCKGGCCVDGDAGAPLLPEERANIDEVLPVVKQYLGERSLEEIEKQGNYVWNDEFGWVTPAIDGGICVYAVTDEKGIVKCAIEQAYREGKVDWKKPISCHLFPIRIKQSEHGDQEYVNYEPREDLCKPACKLGKKLKVPVYQFLKEPLIRKYGQEFYDTLEEIAKKHY